ncbi:MAG: outer membrane lipoprotein-sorting protein [Gammaproteobacteria bacterium]|nr:outer membrane lipoprotein-sorting protein [Gammaproteobacteria bacterium]
MFKKILLTFFLTLFICSVSMATDDVKSILKTADGYRQQSEDMLVKTEVNLYKKDKLDKQSLYDVFLKSGRRSLVVFKSAGEVGQKVLMLDDKFWIMLPNTRRPMRITPLQKLLGEASVGDIATLTWSEDYDGSIIDQNASEQGVSSIKLDLHSTRKGSSYDRIELFVTQKDYFPIKANLYLKSGKLAKEAYYESGKINNKRQVVAMTLLDRIEKDQKTKVYYRGMENKTLPDKYYNPAFLVRTDLPE